MIPSDMDSLVAEAELFLLGTTEPFLLQGLQATVNSSAD